MNSALHELRPSQVPLPPEAADGTAENGHTRTSGASTAVSNSSGSTRSATLTSPLPVQLADCSLGALLGAETYYGMVESVEDAILLVEACRRGLLPRVSRRLGDRDRALIRSGSIFVFVERESGIKRWTDGKIWSPSRITGEFLSYRQLEQRVAPIKRPLGEQIRVLAGRDENFGGASSNKESSERGGTVLKKDGLVKKTISLRVNEETCHLISYSSEGGIEPAFRKTAPSRSPFFALLKDAQIFSSVVPVRNSISSSSSSMSLAPSSMHHLAVAGLSHHPTSGRTPPPILPSRSGMAPIATGAPLRSLSISSAPYHGSHGGGSRVLSPGHGGVGSGSGYPTNPHHPHARHNLASGHPTYPIRRASKPEVPSQAYSRILYPPSCDSPQAMRRRQSYAHPLDDTPYPTYRQVALPSPISEYQLHHRNLTLPPLRSSPGRMENRMMDIVSLVTATEPAVEEAGLESDSLLLHHFVETVNSRERFPFDAGHQ